VGGSVETRTAYVAATPMTPDQLKLRELERRIHRVELEEEILKKATGSLDVGFTEQLKLIRHLQGSCPVNLLCEQLGVSRSSYKYWRSRRRVIGPDKAKLGILVNKKHALSNGSAGSINITAMVFQDGIDLSKYRARCIIKELGLVSCQFPKHA